MRREQAWGVDQESRAELGPIARRDRWRRPRPGGRGVLMRMHELRNHSKRKRWAPPRAPRRRPATSPLALLLFTAAAVCVLPGCGGKKPADEGGQIQLAKPEGANNR